MPGIATEVMLGLYATFPLVIKCTSEVLHCASSGATLNQWDSFQHMHLILHDPQITSSDAVMNMHTIFFCVGLLMKPCGINVVGETR